MFVLIYFIHVFIYSTFSLFSNLQEAVQQSVKQLSQIRDLISTSAKLKPSAVPYTVYSPR